MADILAISTACCTAINRIIYREIAAAGWSVDVAIPTELKGHGFARASDPDRPGDPPIFRLPLQFDTSPRYWRLKGILELCEQRRPKIIFVENDPASLMTLELAAWARLRGAHICVLTCENFYRSPTRDLMQGKYKRAAVSALVSSLWTAGRPFLDLLFALSDESVQVMSEAGYAGKVVKIPWGFDRNLFYPNPQAREATRRELGLTGPTVAYFGRVIPVKGIHLLIEALGQLQDRPWQLLLDKFSEYKDDYAQKVLDLVQSTGISSRTVFFDAGHDEVPRFMNAADIVVVPSLQTDKFKEQYGRVAPEAMACGCAVITSTSGALPELVADTGLVFPQGDVGALAERLAKLLDDEELRKSLAERGTRRAQELLTLQRQRDMMVSCFSTLASPSGKPAEQARAVG
jgi:glycosyltransferase involved in cell wall biosynthesis